MSENQMSNRNVESVVCGYDFETKHGDYTDDLAGETLHVKLRSGGTLLVELFHRDGDANAIEIRCLNGRLKLMPVANNNVRIYHEPHA